MRQVRYQKPYIKASPGQGYRRKHHFGKFLRLFCFLFLLFAVTGLGIRSAHAPVFEQSAFSDQSVDAKRTSSFHSYFSNDFPKLPSILEIGDKNSFFLEKKQVQLTLHPEFQKIARDIFSHYDVPWGSLVAIEPSTGKVLALIDYTHPSRVPVELSTRGTFPAASLFKLVTAAAAIEKGGLQSNSVLRYRGGNTSLGKHNYRPNARLDKRKLTLKAALGKSSNPAFARVGLQYAGSEKLYQYASSFGFNTLIPFELPLGESLFIFPRDDYKLARASAGFGEASISPLHAALMTAGIANKGELMHPYMVERVVGEDGRVEYSGVPKTFQQMMRPETAEELLQMMKSTVISGTARRQFRRVRKSLRRKMDVAGKTGTLSGEDPKGRYHWFVAAAPARTPQIAIAALVIDPGKAKINGTGVGRLFLEKYFRHTLSQ